MTGTCALCPQVPSACSPSATYTGAVPGLAASAAWPRSAVMLAPPPIATTFPCSLGVLEASGGLAVCLSREGHIGRHELAPFPRGLHRFASVSECWLQDSNNNNRGTLSRAQGPPPLKTHVWTSQPQTRDCADWTISGGSGMECLLLFLCLKLYFITQLFFSIKLSISLWDIAD